VLKLVPSINENFKKKMHTTLRQVGKTDLSTITSIIIDEYSMISLGILDMLMAVLPTSCHVTICGDPFQLPPINGEQIEPWEPIEELTTQYRSKNPKGTKMFMDFMYAIRDRSSPPYTKYKTTEGWVSMFNPDTDRILAFTNKEVHRLNAIVAKGVELRIGEELVMNGIACTMIAEPTNYVIYPSCISKGELLDGNKLKMASERASKAIDKWSTNLGMYKTAYVDVDGSQFSIFFDPNHHETEKRLKIAVEKAQLLVIRSNSLGSDEDIPTWCRNNRGRTGVRERGKAWAKYLAHTGYVFSLTRPYATTVHKAQGSEFSKVFINQSDIRKTKHNEQYMRLMYVSLSRAIDEIIFI